MGNTGLLRREAEMTLLQPNLDDLRRQELRNSPFWPSPLFKSQFVKDGEESLIGVLASLEKTIPMGRLHMRPLQWYLKQTGKKSPVTSSEDSCFKSF